MAPGSGKLRPWQLQALVAEGHVLRIYYGDRISAEDRALLSDHAIQDFMIKTLSQSEFFVFQTLTKDKGGILTGIGDRKRFNIELDALTVRPEVKDAVQRCLDAIIKRVRELLGLSKLTTRTPKPLLMSLKGCKPQAAHADGQLDSQMMDLVDKAVDAADEILSGEEEAGAGASASAAGAGASSSASGCGRAGRDGASAAGASGPQAYLDGLMELPCTVVASLGQPSTLLASPYTQEEEDNMFQDHWRDRLYPPVKLPMQRLEVPPFCLVLFSQVKVHMGDGYTVDNVRVHVYFEHPELNYEDDATWAVAGFGPAVAGYFKAPKVGEPGLPSILGPDAETVVEVWGPGMSSGSAAAWSGAGASDEAGAAGTAGAGAGAGSSSGPSSAASSAAEGASAAAAGSGGGTISSTAAARKTTSGRKRSRGE